MHVCNRDSALTYWLFSLMRLLCIWCTMLGPRWPIVASVALALGSWWPIAALALGGPGGIGPWLLVAHCGLGSRWPWLGGLLQGSVKELQKRLTAEQSKNGAAGPGAGPGGAAGAKAGLAAAEALKQSEREKEVGWSVGRFVDSGNGWGQLLMADWLID